MHMNVERKAAEIFTSLVLHEVSFLNLYIKFLRVREEYVYTQYSRRVTDLTL